MPEIEEKLKTVAKNAGADMVGIADLSPFKNGWKVLPDDLLDTFESAISVAIRLDSNIIDDIVDGPTVAYAEHYRAANALLDAITAKLVNWTTDNGFEASAVPASFIADTDNLFGNISHKAIARMAGIGWQGKSLLIISPQYGPRIRLATVLTNMPLLPDAPLKNRCGKCSECAKACPASAIKNISTNGRYESRDEALHFNRCAEKTLEFSARPGIGGRICGVCVKVCPFGKRKHSGKD
ncbi:MAG: epoxyqueuosine reductase [Nitrospirae bacterium]|nr:MAG: epoxyqueuosine reductase [Nitrospirota bacterium]